MKKSNSKSPKILVYNFPTTTQNNKEYYPFKNFIVHVWQNNIVQCINNATVSFKLNLQDICQNITPWSCSKYKAYVGKKMIYLNINKRIEIIKKDWFGIFKAIILDKMHWWEVTIVSQLEWKATTVICWYSLSIPI